MIITLVVIVGIVLVPTLGVLYILWDSRRMRKELEEEGFFD